MLLEYDVYDDFRNQVSKTKKWSTQKNQIHENNNNINNQAESQAAVNKVRNYAPS